MTFINIKGCNYQIIMFDVHLYAFYMFLFCSLYILYLKVCEVARSFCIIYLMVMVVCFILNNFTFPFHFALCFSSTCLFVIQDFDWHLLSCIETLLMYSGRNINNNKEITQHQIIIILVFYTLNNYIILSLSGMGLSGMGLSGFGPF